MDNNHFDPKGKRLPTFDEYTGNLLPIEFKDDNCKINNYGCLTDNEGDYIAIRTGDDKFRLMPGPEFSPRLYRGQNCYYPDCKPSIYRIKEYPKYVLNKIKLFEFIKLIGSSPIVGLMRNLKIMGCSFSVAFHGLAQHYELETEMLDFTRSKDISMFFALCEKNWKSGCYEPILDETKEAVIYSLDIKKMVNSGETVNIIGMQPLLRPYKQKACSINMRDNLNTKPYITYTKIRVNKKEAVKYYEMFDGGKVLFPEEIVNNKANEIKKSRAIDKEVVDYMFKEKIFSESVNNTNDLVRVLKDEDVEITDKAAELSFSKDETVAMQNNWRIIESDLIKKIKVRAIVDPI
jgi:hypothetical protein